MVPSLEVDKSGELNNLGRFSGSKPNALIIISAFISNWEFGIGSGFFLPEASGLVRFIFSKRIEEIYEINPIPQPSIELINFLANWYCAYKGLVLKMVLSPVEAITSTEYKKVYKS